MNTYIATLEFITRVLSDIKTQACQSLPCGAANLQKNKGMRKIKRYDGRLDVSLGTSSGNENWWSARIPVFYPLPISLDFIPILGKLGKSVSGIK